VPSRRTFKPAAAKAVFVNCPFDDGFKPILRAMVFTIISSGYHPRCALDATDGAEVRVGKIARMIGECDWAIHDLSRVEVDAGGVPRFNMPMELGLHLGARLLGHGRQRRKKALILDAERHRYDAALSDISGQDIETHENDPNQAMRCVCCARLDSSTRRGHSVASAVAYSCSTFASTRTNLSRTSLVTPSSAACGGVRKPVICAVAERSPRVRAAFTQWAKPFGTSHETLLAPG
jgi:hypothetical protein